MRRYDPEALDRRDPRLIARVKPLLDAFARRYLSLESEGTEWVTPAPALYVANHNGGIVGPDLFCTLSVLWGRLGAEALLYALAHDFAMRQFTPLGRIIQRFGALPASRKSAERVLSMGGQVLVYPGGDLEAYRAFHRKNEIVLLPRTGFVEVARALGVPILPIVTQGAHASAVIFVEGRRIARALRMPRWARLERFPLALALPWGLAAGPWLPYLPLPVRVRLRILPPMWIAANEPPLAAARRVQHAMQRALSEMAAA